jgi:hypothetical protein
MALLVRHRDGGEGSRDDPALAPELPKTRLRKMAGG